MRKTELDDRLLRKAVEEMDLGLVDADLGGNVYKKRVALPGRGKRGSTRTLIATNNATRWIFLYGYKKNERDDITPDELTVYRMLAREFLECTDMALKSIQAYGELEEVHDE
jgi:hypothetical protein